MNPYYQGMFLELQCCPHCQAQLVKRGDFLVCRYHKWGYPIINDTLVNYKMTATVKNFKTDLHK